ncbi:PilZ domain-containing protein [Porphyrobacter sp. TH134]|uniref:PilZ domain-containing protein n=1 Tax=Porphyrobacter sp. TH134 TaxID=2067450 RepID=UPI000C7A27DE|nr:PilZ domain-containing protein [Porphyrobacter sp. TH134]
MTGAEAAQVAGAPVDDRVRGGQERPDTKSNGHIPAAMPVGRRSAPRLRLSLPAQLVAVDKAHTCILLNLSRSGAQVAILDSVRVGEGAMLRCGVINHFVLVTRSEFGLNALVFDEPLTDEIVLETRRYHETFEERERRAMIETARKWVTGDDDGRLI